MKRYTPKVNKYLKKVTIEKYNSGISTHLLDLMIPPLRYDYYQIRPETVGGDAPKDFIGLYEYDGKVRRQHPNTWVRHVAKVGHKWYPFESIMEHLLNRIGEVLGLNMASSQLRMAHGQLRFLSRYFLKPEEGQSMMHGAQIYSTYLGDGKDNTKFIDEIEYNKLARQLLTFQLTDEAIKFVFPNQHENIMGKLVQLLLFDAMIGNNDRHHYNWAIITNNIKSDWTPVFSPIYDTARGLFWNESEENLNKHFFYQRGGKAGQINEEKLEKYIKNSRPKTGWEGWKGKKKENHFELLKLIYEHYPQYRNTCNELLKNVSLNSIIDLIDNEFKLYFTEKRYILTIRCLEIRFNRLQNLCK
mgnify:CR=1 FL=1